MWWKCVASTCNGDVHDLHEIMTYEVYILWIPKFLCAMTMAEICRQWQYMRSTCDGYVSGLHSMKIPAVTSRWVYKGLHMMSMCEACIWWVYPRPEGMTVYQVCLLFMRPGCGDYISGLPIKVIFEVNNLWNLIKWTLLVIVYAGFDTKLRSTSHSKEIWHILCWRAPTVIQL